MGGDHVIESLSDQAKALWAKTGSGEDRLSWEPLYVHLFDSAEVSRLVWRDYLSESVKTTIANSLGLTKQDAQCVVAWIVSNHDIGKATPAFQNNRYLRDLWERDLNAGFPAITPVDRPPHAFLGQVLFGEWLESQQGYPNGNQTIASIIGGHHGIYPSTKDLKDIHTFESEVLGTGLWRATQEELLNATFEAYLGPEVAKKLFATSVSPAIEVLLTAIEIMADWVASNTELFPLVQSVNSLGELQQRAAAAWQYLGLPKAIEFAEEDLAPNTLFHRRFPSLPAGAKLNSVQLATITAATAMDAPGLMIIEAPMGCGKTEASLLGAEILAHKFGQSGIAYLLPTQATSNAMFDRVESWLDDLLHDQCPEGPQDLHLLHSKAALDESFRALPKWKPGTMGDQTSNNKPTEEMLVAHQWFGGRKRGLVLPAHAGMIRSTMTYTARKNGAPRTCGNALEKRSLPPRILSQGQRPLLKYIQLFPFISYFSETLLKLSDTCCDEFEQTPCLRAG